MDRLIYQDLIDWKISDGRKPLMLEGARQVGKTYLMKHFGRQEYEHFYYLSFDETPEACSLFEGAKNAEAIIKKLSTYFQTNIDPNNSLICIDEIQECQDAITSLKYLCQDSPQYHVMTAGSLLGVKAKKESSFPVGYVTFRSLYPMSFLEFLNASGKNNLVELIANLSIGEKLPEIFHNDLVQQLKTYYYIGGMPEGVAKYVKTSDFEKVRQIHKDILRSYELDFTKHATPTEAAKISLVWNSVPAQLAKENQKFIYSVIRPSARAREYENAIQWLIDANLILKCNKVIVPGVPLKAYANIDIFKTFMLDVGLMSTMSRLTSKTLIEGNKLFTHHKGALSENYIAQSLYQMVDDQLYYWASDGKAELDFIFQNDEQIIPVEVKSGRDKRKQSLRVYREKYNPKMAIRASLHQLDYDKNLLSIPLYAISELKDFLEEVQK